METDTLKNLDQLVREYAEWVKTECVGEGQELPPLIQLALTADMFTAYHVAQLLLNDNEVNSDAAYRRGGEFFDQRLAEIADQIAEEDMGYGNFFRKNFRFQRKNC